MPRRAGTFLVEAFDIEHDRDQAPEAIARRHVIDKHRNARDEALASLNEFQGTGENQATRVAGTLGGLALRRQLAVVEPDRSLVAGEGVHEPDHHIRRGPDVAQERTPLEQRPRRPLEFSLGQPGIGGDHGHEAPRELDVAVELVFQSRLQHPHALAHLVLRNEALPVEALSFDEIGSEQQHHCCHSRHHGYLPNPRITFA